MISHGAMRTERLILQIPVDVYNGGFYDINDLTLTLALSDNSTGSIIASNSSIPVNVIHGQWNDLVLKVSLDMRKVSNDTIKKLVFTGANLTMGIAIGAEYVEKMVSLSVGGNSSVVWESTDN